MADKCLQCKRKPTRTRVLNANNVCTECIVEIPSAGIDDSKNMGDLTFGEFKVWVSSALQEIVNSIVAVHLEASTKRIVHLETENNSLKKKVKEIEKKIEESKKEVGEIRSSIKDTKIVSDNNLKYLINSDRNTRRHNVIIFGVKENEDLTINNKTANTDIKKRDLILEYTEVDDLLVINRVL